MEYPSLDQPDWRRDALGGATILGVWLWLGTEALSAFQAITFAGVATFWLATAILIVTLVRRYRLQPAAGLGQQLRTLAGNAGLWLPALVCIVIAAVLLLVALVAAPNNWDSLTYHLSRVMHWQQDRSIAFYATANLRQLHLGPWAEMVTLHLTVLSGGERLDNLVQWSAMVGSLVGISYLAKLLGASARGQLLAAVVAATIPIGVMQATSTQNDYVVTWWILCFAVFSLLGRREPQRRRYWLLAGAALGLAVLTKITAVVLLAPLGAWLGLTWLRRLRAAAWQPILALALTALAINAGQFARNAALFGSPLGPAADYVNEIITPPALASNLLRNVALHLGTPAGSLNRAIETAIDTAHGWLGLSPEDPRLTYLTTRFAVIDGNNESDAGDVLGLILAVACLALLPQLRDRQLTIFSVCLLGGFVLFCAVLKWQPWHSRLHLPLFVLGAAALGAALSRVLSGRSQQVVMAVLGLGALPALLFNGTRPLLGPGSILIQPRTAQYFAYAPQLEAGYVQAAALIRRSHCEAVGLLENLDDAEYPWWVLTDAARSGITLRAVAVDNVSSRLMLRFSPCALLDTRGDAAAQITLGETTYQQVFRSDPVSVYMVADRK